MGFVLIWHTLQSIPWHVLQAINAGLPTHMMRISLRLVTAYSKNVSLLACRKWGPEYDHAYVFKSVCGYVASHLLNEAKYELEH